MWLSGAMVAYSPEIPRCTGVGTLQCAGAFQRRRAKGGLGLRDLTRRVRADYFTGVGIPGEAHRLHRIVPCLA